ncbi:PAS domain-containing sensor histidine kinase [Rhizobium sp. Root482]|uniref:PAS domain-containing sensor histidine kinase n=1 Tax=Rhizobium sp. Root482 TaxID=1736543 RepID=UPI0006F4DC0B|nr:PAS domain-containing sensor histidine kinase [Rhizobium sp. Root482]KQY14451.1 hypothetical protein ASD31_09300 [Rhizobium sp. Root482]
MPIAQKHFITALYDSFPDPVVIFDAAKVVIGINDAAIRQFGYAGGDMTGLQARVLFESDMEYRDCLEKDWPTIRDPGFSSSVYCMKRADGTVFDARLRVTEVAGEDERAQGFIGVIDDISDLLELDAQRRKAAETLDTALQAIPEGFAIFDKDERLLVYNDAYRRICGAAGEHLHVGMTAEAIMQAAHLAGNYPTVPKAPSEAAEWIGSRLRDFRNPTSRTQVFPYGDGRWMRAENLPTRDGNTVVLRIDVTELKEAELARDRQRLEYFSLVQSIPDFIVRISREKRCTFVNDRYAQFIGLPATELIGEPLMKFVPEPDRARLGALLDDLSPEQPTVMREQRRLRPDGQEFWVLWCNIAIFDAGNLVEYVTVGRDITELKQQQTRIAQQHAELQRKNEALHQFTGTVSHDLKAPLRHMAMFSEMIEEGLAAGKFEELPTYARHLRQSARRMNQLVDSLLDYAQIADQIGNWQTVSMGEVIADAILNLNSFIQEAGAGFEFSNLPKVQGDPELLKRLCQNLIGNAIKYRREGVPPLIRISCEKEDGMLRISFEDNGIGVDPRFAKKIFDVFQRLHRDESVYQGTGIGLALAKRIAESHNGSLSLDTTFALGARFVLLLPDMT